MLTATIFFFFFFFQKRRFQKREKKLNEFLEDSESLINTFQMIKRRVTLLCIGRLFFFSSNLLITVRYIIIIIHTIFFLLSSIWLMFLDFSYIAKYSYSKEIKLLIGNVLLYILKKKNFCLRTFRKNRMDCKKSTNLFQMKKVFDYLLNCFAN